MGEVIDFKSKTVEKQISQQNTEASKSYLAYKREDTFVEVSPNHVVEPIYNTLPQEIIIRIIPPEIRNDSNWFRNLCIWLGIIFFLALFTN